MLNRSHKWSQLSLGHVTTTPSQGGVNYFHSSGSHYTHAAAVIRNFRVKQKGLGWLARCGRREALEHQAGSNCLPCEYLMGLNVCVWQAAFIFKRRKNLATDQLCPISDVCHQVISWAEGTREELLSETWGQTRQMTRNVSGGSNLTRGSEKGVSSDTLTVITSAQSVPQTTCQKSNISLFRNELNQIQLKWSLP